MAAHAERRAHFDRNMGGRRHDHAGQGAVLRLSVLRRVLRSLLQSVCVLRRLRLRLSLLRLWLRVSRRLYRLWLWRAPLWRLSPRLSRRWVSRRRLSQRQRLSWGQRLSRWRRRGAPPLTICYRRASTGGSSPSAAGAVGSVSWSRRSAPLARGFAAGVLRRCVAPWVGSLCS